jgi:Domain of unknown function (DUF4349)
MTSSARFAALAVLLCLFGCGAQYESDRGADTQYAPNNQPSPANQEKTAVPPTTTVPVATDTTSVSEEAPTAPDGSPGTPPPAPVERQIIRSGQIWLRVPSLDTAEKALARIATTNGGYTANSSRMRESGNTLSGTTEIRFPSAKFDQVVASVHALGEVLTESITSADVTAEYIDLNARLKTQQELEARLLKLLNDRTGKLADVIEVEAKLAEIRNQIESVQGRLRYLRSQVSLSTLTVNMVEPGAAGSSQTETFGGRIARAIERGIDGLIDTLGGFITIGIALIPFIAIGIGVYYAAIRPWRRRRKERQAAEAHPAIPKAKGNTGEPS